MRLHEEVPTAIYCGVDFHPRQPFVCYCDADDGEIRYRELHHESEDLHSFYSQFTGEVIVGLEASDYSAWFEQLLAGPGLQVWLGDAAEIRRRAKRGREREHLGGETKVKSDNRRGQDKLPTVRVGIMGTDG